MSHELHYSSNNVRSFFDDFPDFVQDPSAPISAEFARLAAHRQWKKGARSKTYERNWSKCIRMEFDNFYGKEYTKLESWQNICTEVGIEPLSSVTKCKKALSKVNVNLVNLIDCRTTGEKPLLFPSLDALRKYTRKRGRAFPREEAKEDGFIKILLKRIY
ncbi:conserved hypothetical protein [Talaromyces stipitatus ATCC 10500]|uniref:Uncharacterized protein n=1 Tax=Talaromyces stipitatus (strain ATCC 10500 / CBS 375.48 / QM 6759 / NRRL 1006) TaxID=441959 RepID=B8LZI3_TALSN|nr:uncharacterized protein TSTA_093110 [Talaromyces stipitatus ATCC 10500]EED22065.1 conserved hypothetical protein [Talaromyces stipitatus ATCC 10500]